MAVQIDLSALMDEAKAKKRRVESASSNWASQIGDPCTRYLVYMRTRGHERQLPDVNLQYIFDEGRLHEKALLRELQDDMGVEIRELQRGWPTNKQNISGRIDAEMKDLDGKWKPLEAKSISPYEFVKLPENVMDFLKSPKRWLRRYPGQMMTYLYYCNQEEGLLVFKNKLSGRIRQINCVLDFAYTESLLKKAEAIESHLRAGTLPDRVEESVLHDSCPFYHLCLPDSYVDGIFKLDPELESKVDRLQELKAQAKPITEELEELREMVKEASNGQEKLIVGKWLITNKIVHKASYVSPAVDYRDMRIKEVQEAKAKSLKKK